MNKTHDSAEGVAAATLSVETEPLRYVQARPGWHFVDLAEVWRHRRLVWILGLRDLKVRYRQTLVGIAWALLEPLTMTVIFVTLFTLLRRAPSGGDVPYAAIVVCGIIPWRLFASTLSQCSNCLVANSGLLTKVYFPRLVLPLSTLMISLVDFAVACVALVAVILWYGIVPTWAVLTVPIWILMATMTSIALGLWLAALNAIYRDVGFLVPFLIQTGFFVSPVFYQSTALVPERWQLLYSLNPMVGVLEGFRWALLGQAPPNPLGLLLSLALVGLLLAGGLLYFRRMERFFADRI